MRLKLSTAFSMLTFLLITYSFDAAAQIENIVVGTTTREMLVYAPADIEANRPLMISMHGLNQDIAYQQNQTKWEEVAKANNFVVVYPGGINRSWDISGNRDTDFILVIIDEMSKRYNIDRNRVYLSGFSMGGMMTYHAATKIADYIAAFAPVSGYLMGGPKTNSSRPIPIIHTHGTTDDVVGYSGVQRCMDVWIARNNCPTGAVITKPYPADKPSSNGTKYYWGPGTDSVEIVLLSLQGVGHWHSNNPSGVHTSQEIWNFCKKYTLAFGVPELEKAYVKENNPKELALNFSLPIQAAESYDGFSVNIDQQAANIESVTLLPPAQLAIQLSDSISINSEIVLSYNKGNILSSYGKALANFENAFVENLLPGAPPRIVNIFLTTYGDTLVIQFNKKMNLPVDISGLTIQAEYNGNFNISTENVQFHQNDSSSLAFTLSEQVFAGYALWLSYNGNTIVSFDQGQVGQFSNQAIDNTAKGKSVQLLSGKLEDNAIVIVLSFTKPMKIKEEQIDQVLIKVNGNPVSVAEALTVQNDIRFILKNNCYPGDSIKVSYTPGNIVASDSGDLLSFNSIAVDNPLQTPSWLSIPGKIEAEAFALQYGTDTEQTNDEGDGLNVGWTDTGDWLVYALNNNSGISDFDITFRIAAESSGSRFEYFIDDENQGSLFVPSTGGWQNWKSAKRSITIPPGKHYLKILIKSGGFNLNWFELSDTKTGSSQFSNVKLSCYPNPVNNELTIESPALINSKIELLNITGAVLKTIQNGDASYLIIPIELPNGSYLVKITNPEGTITQKIQVKNQ